MKKISLLLLASILLISCSSENTNIDSKASELKDTKKNSCSYSLQKKSTSVTWTAYKLTDKVAVGGTFDKVSTRGGDKSPTLAGMIDGTRFIILASSVNSNNETRDPKIVTSFFGNIAQEGAISGEIRNAKGTDRVGKCEALLNFNGVEKSVSLSYKLTDNKLSITGGLDLNDWNAQTAISELNKVCEEKHRGEDGKSILWPDIDLSIEATVITDCK